jgi:SAM-dependent methyltransferase
LSRAAARRTSAAVSRDLFDRHLRSLRRDRASAMGPELFLLDRAFDECLDRLRDISRPFDRVLMLGCPSPDWLQRLPGRVDVFDPGPAFARAAEGTHADEDRFDFGEDAYDLCLAIGTLDTVNELPLALQLIRRALRPDAPLVGAMAGGNSLATLRASFLDADRSAGRATMRTHPRIEAPSLAGLLSSAGFDNPVVDVDRVRLRYATLADLVRDLRAMAATSVLLERPPLLGRETARRATDAFASRSVDGKTAEIVEILHFIAWNPVSRSAAG